MDESKLKEKNDQFQHDSDQPHEDDIVRRGSVRENADDLQRSLRNRQIQLLAIGGSIGTALFVSIGGGLNKGGPASLFLAYTLHSCMLGLVNNGMAEMGTLHPVSGGFIRMAGKWVDDAFGFMAGWNFFFYEALLIPFEITAFHLVLSFWTDKVPVAAICAFCIIAYGMINCLAVRAYGEAEFWLSGGKVILIFMLFFYTFITMVGGNPKHDAYGFRYWRDPGSFAEYRSTGDKGRFEGFLGALWSAGFTVVGPEYIAMAAAEAMRPRIYVKTAFKTVYFRFGLFFILGALCVGIVIPYNDPTLVKILASGATGTAAASPYVIGMSNLGIKVLPDIVNALMLTSIFSAGNTYTYCAIRNLYGLSLDGRAPKIFSKTLRNGTPIYAFAMVMCFPFLSFLQVSGGSAKVLSWLVSLITAGGLIDYIVMCVTYIQFYNGCKAQGLDRRTFPYFGRFQPYCAYIGAVYMTLVTLFYGYYSFGPWSVTNFFTNYTMQLVMPVLFIGWKLIKRTKWRKPSQIDLQWEREFVDAYEESFTEYPVGFWIELLQLFGLCKNRKGKAM